MINKLILTAAVLALGAPAGMASAQDGPELREQLQHLRDHVAHDEAHRQIGQAHEKAHEGGFSSRENTRPITKGFGNSTARCTKSCPEPITRTRAAVMGADTAEPTMAAAPTTLRRSITAMEAGRSIGPIRAMSPGASTGPRTAGRSTPTTAATEAFGAGRDAAPALPRRGRAFT